jgi:serine/threonine protein kinase
VALVLEHLGDGDRTIACMHLWAGGGIPAAARRDETEKHNPCASDNGKNNIERDAAILRCLRPHQVVQLHEILAMSKKVHFMLDLAANDKLFSLMDSSENLLLDESGNLKVADFGLGVAASSSDQHLRSRKLVNPRGIWN